MMLVPRRDAPQPSFGMIFALLSKARSRALPSNRGEACAIDRTLCSFPPTEHNDLRGAFQLLHYVRVKHRAVGSGLHFRLAHALLLRLQRIGALAKATM